MIDRLTTLAFRYGPYVIIGGAATYFLFVAGRGA